jgi:GMP synthase (glutamine-hydrolysing)
MILIVDFGSQTTHLIGRRLRQLGINGEYVEPKEALLIAQEKKPSGIIFSGGPDFVTHSDSPTVDKKLFSLGIPILGICYGQQLMAHLLGGRVTGANKEFGPEMLTIKSRSVLFKAITDKSFSVIMSHGDSVTTLPPGFTCAASTPNIPNASMINESRNLYAVQFHPEADHTTHGLLILKNFVSEVCKEKITPFQLDQKKIISLIKDQVGDKKVVMAVSGGVDSTVAAFLIGKAIGKRLIPVYVESGFMRPGTGERVRKIFIDDIKANLVFVNAQQRFLSALQGVTDPEVKRKIIGKLYIDIFQEEAVKYTDVSFLGQGTIYSDVIESKGSKLASHIKSHHNVGGLPKDMKYKLLEPMRSFYKDEVRELGRLSGLSDEIVNQQPFPGPGYAVRIRGEVTKERLAQLLIADRIVLEEMKIAKLYEKVFQCFAVMTGAYSTAVKGDGRVFAEVVAVRAYESKDIMTSQWARIPHDVLAKISSRIVNEVPNISRVVYDITSKPPATMEWE